MSINRRKKNLTIEEKVALLRRLEAGAKNKDVAAEFGVVHSAISYMVRNKETIYKQHRLLLEQQGDRKRTKMSGVEESPLEKAIYQWYKQKRNSGEPISGPMLKEKALDFARILGGPSNFRASDGWLTRFKGRHGIRSISKRGGKLSNEEDEGQLSPDNFSNYLKHHMYNLENVYNASEISLTWKSLPSKKSVSSEHVVDRVTIIACVNATGSHKIPLFVVGQEKNSRCFKNVIRLPVVYRSSENALIDRTVFNDWYTSVFLSSIKSKNNKEITKFLLLLETRENTFYPSVEYINGLDSTCSVFYLSLKPSEANQPMDQGIVQSMKVEYRKHFLLDILMQDPVDEKDVVAYVRQWTLLDFCRTLSNSWESLSVLCITNAWKKVLTGISVFDDDNEFLADIATLLHKIPGGDQFSIQEMRDWMQREKFLPIWKMVKDERISTSNENLDTIVKEEENIDGPNEEEEEEEEEESCGPSVQEAFSAIKTLYEWCETHWEYEEQDLYYLRQIHRVATDIFMDTVHSEATD